MLSKREAIHRELCEQEHLHFTRLFFQYRQNQPFIVNWHHHWMSDVVQGVINGEIENAVINVSPGGTKTELIVINLIARGLALNPRARFLHLSYSDDLALLNSQTARDIIRSDEYQALWPLAIADDTKAKKRWNVVQDGKPAGGVYATSLDGQVTGFRAGHMADGFQGAIIVDDPLKPEDAFSKTKLDRANRKLLTTVKSRKANPLTPIIVVMQRIAENDPTGFIKNGNVGGNWTHVVIPAIIDDEAMKLIPEKYHAMINHQPGTRVSYWERKEKLVELEQMETGSSSDKSGSRISRHVFASQYQQNPVAIGGNIIRGEWFPRYKMLPKLKERRIYADTAQKTKERNDYSVFECWGLGDDKKMYLLDLIRGKWEAPELKRRAIAFWNKHKAMDIDIHGALTKMKVEDKSSGTGLIQEIKADGHIPVDGVERSKDKLTRVMDGQSYMEAGSVLVPDDAPFVNDFIAECEAFTADDTHTYDDQIDPMLDGIVDFLGSGNKLRVWEMNASKF
jgi:predicted phage terminase large subunit-like protein